MSTSETSKKKPSSTKSAATKSKSTTDSTATDDETREPEQIKAEIEDTREDLGDTVAALAEKTDVKAQAKKKADETKEQAQAKLNEASATAKTTLSELPEKAQQNPLPYAAAAVGALAAIWLLRRRS